MAEERPRKPEKRRRRIHIRPGVKIVVSTKRRGVIVLPPDADWRKE